MVRGRLDPLRALWRTYWCHALVTALGIAGWLGIILSMGCSVALNTSKGACYHGTILDVRNGGWSQTCGSGADEASSMTAFQEPMSEEFAEFLTRLSRRR